MIDGEKSVVVERLRMYLPLETDVLETDRIDTVKDRAGATVHPGILNIRSIVRRSSHLELELQGAA